MAGGFLEGYRASTSSADRDVPSADEMASAEPAKDRRPDGMATRIGGRFMPARTVFPASGGEAGILPARSERDGAGFDTFEIVVREPKPVRSRGVFVKLERDVTGCRVLAPRSAEGNGKALARIPA